MISKLSASWLIVLVLSPFTAPFSTCDLASLIGDPANGKPFVPQVTAAAAADTNAVVVPARLVPGRPQLPPRVGHVETSGPTWSHNVALFGDAIPPIQGHEAHHTILRL